MKLRFFTFLVSFLTVMSGAVWGQSGSGTQDNPWIYDITEGNIDIKNSGYYIIKGNSEQTKNVIDVNATTGKVHITLNNVKIDARKIFDYDAGCPFDINPNTDVTVKLEGYNEFVSGYNQAGIHVHVGGKLTITADADDDNHRLHAECLCAENNKYASGAGIGGAGPYSGNQNAGSFGTIVIEGGKISARSYGKSDGIIIEDTYGAGIGGGHNSEEGTIIIKGGIIDASSVNEYNLVGGKRALGAGIGGGYEGTCDNITILGGKINATSKNGVSIGNGNDYTTSAPSIIIARWDKGATYPEVTAGNGITETNFIDDREDKKHYSGEVYLPEGTQMYVENLDNQNVSLKAYAVSYKDNLPQGVATIAQLPQNNDNLYFGPNTSFELEDWNASLEETNPNDNATYAHVNGLWLNSNNEWKEAGINTTGDGSDLNTYDVKNIEYGAAWYLKQFNPIYSKNKGLLEDRKVWVPTIDGLFNVKEQEEGTPDGGGNWSKLSDAGLKQEKGHILSAKDESAELTDGTYYTRLNLVPNGVNGKTFSTDIKATVTDRTFNMTETTITLKGSSFEYRGTEIPKNEVVDVTVSFNGDNIDINDSYYVVEYSYDKVSWGNIPLKNKGTYYVKVSPSSETILEGDPKIIEETVEITAKALTIEPKDLVWTIGEEEDYPTEAIFDLKGKIGDDDVSVAAGYSISNPNATTAGVYNIDYTNLSLTGNASGNYSCKENATGRLIAKKEGTTTDPIDPNPDGKDPIIKPGGGDNDGWTWDSANKLWERVYDGKPHMLTSISVTYTYETVEGETKTKTETLKIGEGADATITYSTEPGTTQATEIKDAGTYYAHITINKAGFVYSGNVAPIKLLIDKRPLKVTVNEFTEEDLNKTSIGTEDVTFENEGENRGLLSEEALKASAEVEFEKNGDKYKVTFSNATIQNGDNDKGKASNYKATWYYGNKQIGTDGDGNGSIDIDDPTGGDGDGGIIVSYHDLHIAESVGAKLVSRSGKDRTPDGGSFTLSLEKEEGYEDCEPTVYYKRGRFGEWKELKLDEVSGYYQIRSVYTDIYVKVSGDGIWPVSNEEVEAQEVKVYTQNGAIVVVTPSVMDVQVVSMTGSVVAADKVAGQREFRNLVEGVYIVRVEDEIVKVRL